MKALALLLAAALLLAVPASAEAPPPSTSLDQTLPLRFRAVPEIPPPRLLTRSTPLLLARVQGASMEPLLLEGELAVYIPITHVVNLRPGEVAIYDSATCPLFQRGLVAHRMVRVVDDAYAFRGDANPIADSCRVTRDMLTGVVVGVLWMTEDAAQGVQ